MAFRDKLRQVLKVQDTPHRIALAFAMGVFWGISPLLGLHTVGALLTAWLFGLNRLVAVVGVYITNPWTIVPIYSFCILVGSRIVGLRQIIPDIDWNGITFMQMMTELKHLILPFVVGTLVVALFSSIASYFIIHRSVTGYKKTYAGNE